MIRSKLEKLYDERDELIARMRAAEVAILKAKAKGKAVKEWEKIYHEMSNGLDRISDQIARMENDF